MIAELGLAALWLAAGLSLVQLLLSIAELRTELNASRAVRSIAIVQGVLTALAMIALLLVFARTDLSVALVAENSHSAKPYLYKVAAAWGNHEGSMLLWMTVLGLSGADAITCALKTSLLATKKPRVVSFTGSYHGLSYGPLAALGSGLGATTLTVHGRGGRGHAVAAVGAAHALP